jgi:hypothetical protein
VTLRRSFTRRLRRHWTPLDVALLAVAVLVIAVGLLMSQEPPLPTLQAATSAPAALPPAAITNTVRVSWDRNPASDYFHALDSEGNPVPLLYRVRMSTDIARPHGQWTVLAETTNTTAVLTNLVAANLFFTVTASNFFLESEPSSIVAIPWDPPTKLRLIVE